MASPHRRSKKRSAANFPSKPLKPIVFFLDRSLGRKLIADALRQAGAKVEIHDDHFPPDAKDQEWLSEVGAKGWFVITKDQRIRYRIIERNALISARVGAFVLTSGSISAEEMAQILVEALPKIKRFITRHPLPFIARVTRSGELSALTD